MGPAQPAIEQFLAQRRIAVAGVSRHENQPANAIFRRLRGAGYEVFPVNPAATEVEGVPCYASLAAIPGGVDAVMVVTPPEASPGLVEEAAGLGVRWVWLHRGLGPGSASPEAVELGRQRVVEVIDGGCPMMEVPPVDIFHRCLRWFRS